MYAYIHTYIYYVYYIYTHESVDICEHLGSDFQSMHECQKILHIVCERNCQNVLEDMSM